MSRRVNKRVPAPNKGGNELAKLQREISSLRTMVNKMSNGNVKVASRVSRVVEIPIISSSNSLPTFGAIQFSLNSLPSYTEFTTLYERFRIEKIEISFFSEATDTDTTTADPGIFWVTPDYDDAVAPTAISQLQQYQTVRFQRGVNKEALKLTIKPRPSIALYSGSAFTNYGQATGAQWIDANSPGTPHYGIKWGWDATSAVFNMRVVVRYFLAFGEVY